MHLFGELHTCVCACRSVCMWIYEAMGLHMRVHLDVCKEVCVAVRAHRCVPGCVFGTGMVLHTRVHRHGYVQG